jgi:hypothetical protein
MATPISTINPFITKSQFTTQQQQQCSIESKTESHTRMIKFESKIHKQTLNNRH